MRKFTRLEDMIEQVEVGDSIEITYLDECAYNSKSTVRIIVGIIEKRDDLYNVLFDDGYGDDSWEETSLQELILHYYEAWSESGESISLIKGNYCKPKDPQEVYEFIAEALKRKYGDNVRYGYSDGSLANANKIGIGAGIAVDCDDQPNGTDIWINIGYFY